VKSSKRVRLTPLEQAAHGVCSWRSTTGKRVEVAVVGEHNSPSRPTPRPRDQFQVHELTGDIGHDGTLPNPERDSSWPDDYSPTKEEPSQQTPISPTCRTLKFAKVGITLQMSINQFVVAI
jgi:hypothetical protein